MDSWAVAEKLERLLGWDREPDRRGEDHETRPCLRRGSWTVMVGKTWTTFYRRSYVKETDSYRIEQIKSVHTNSWSEILEGSRMAHERLLRSGKLKGGLA